MRASLISERSQETIKRVVRYLLLTVIIVYIVSGFGITEFRTVESLTLGVLTKPLSFKIHNYLLPALAALLILHISLQRIFRSPR